MLLEILKYAGLVALLAITVLLIVRRESRTATCSAKNKEGGCSCCPMVSDCTVLHRMDELPSSDPHPHGARHETSGGKLHVPQ